MKEKEKSKSEKCGFSFTTSILRIYLVAYLRMEDLTFGKLYHNFTLCLTAVFLGLHVSVYSLVPPKYTEVCSNRKCEKVQSI